MFDDLEEKAVDAAKPDALQALLKDSGVAHEPRMWEPISDPELEAMWAPDDAPVDPIRAWLESADKATIFTAPPSTEVPTDGR